MDEKDENLYKKIMDTGTPISNLIYNHMTSFNFDKHEENIKNIKNAMKKLIDIINNDPNIKNKQYYKDIILIYNDPNSNLDYWSFLIIYAYLSRYHSSNEKINEILYLSIEYLNKYNAIVYSKEYIKKIRTKIGELQN